jgi:tRNA A-37 threonylcarbamoyl transferase component Bud32
MNARIRSGKGLQIQDKLSIRDEEKKLAEIRQVTYQRMNETTKKLEIKADAIRAELETAKKALHSTYKTLHAQPINIHQRRIETLLKKRPSIEDLVYRGIFVDPARRRSREIATDVISEMLRNRKRNSGSYSASWMFSPDSPGGSFHKETETIRSRSTPGVSSSSPSVSSEDEKRKREFQHLLQKERCLIDFAELTDQRLVAEGAFAHVYRGQWRGLPVAVKIMKPRENVLKICQAEVICLLLAKSNPHVIKLVGACVEPPCIVTPYSESGSLFDCVHKRKMKFTLDKLLSISKEIAMGLAGLHTLDPPLMHRDVSTNNILLDENSRPLIIDFGIAREELTGGTPHSPIGHPRLRAPEISNNKPYTKSVDVYNFGTVMFELATGRLPHEELPDSEAAFCTSRGLTPAIPEHLPSRFRKLISQCWELDPSLRPPFKTILFELQRIQEELDAPMPLRKSTRSLSKGHVL